MVGISAVALRAAARAIGVPGLEQVGDPLGGSSRSVVVRTRPIHTGPASTGPTEVGPTAGGSVVGGTVVVKLYDPALSGEGWLREVAALEVLTRTHRCAPGPDRPAARLPRLLGVVAEPPLVVLSDVGAGPSLADALLGAGPTAAASRLLAWAEALGALHRSTTGLAAEFAAALARHAAPGTAAADPMPAMLEDAAGRLADLLPTLGVDPSGPELAELTGLSMRTAASALTPSDACPDNNLEVDGRLVLLDFEGAAFRHVAWDAAYLTVPWPSCWCSWRLDDDAAGRALESWRRAVLPALPEVTGEAFEADLRTARTGWAFISTGWFLRAALEPDGAQPIRAGSGPDRRSLVGHRLAALCRSGSDGGSLLTGPGGLAARIVDRLRTRWGRTPLDLAPAFRPPPAGPG